MPPDHIEIRRQLDTILQSRAFADAERARRFLRYVVEAALAGQAEAIKESVIGVEVMGRPASFDPRSDPIVRVEAGRLRTRLEAYYNSEGGDDLVSIHVPKGTYVPQFSRRTAPQPAADPSKKRVRLVVALVAATATLTTLVGTLLWSTLFSARSDGRNQMVLSVLPPDGTYFRNSAVSPDGQYLAFTATEGNITSLWLRAMDSADAQKLPGTDGAAYPFWAPDSRTIAFFSVGKLKEISVSGGPTQVVCDVQAAFGGSWGRRKIILFAQRPSGTLFQVSADGGLPSEVTKLDRGRGELAHLFPYFLPDGKHFLYSVISGGPSEATLRVGSLDSDESKAIASADPGSAYQPAHSGHSGSLLFAYHGALIRQAFDDQALHLRGAASQVAPQVKQIGERADFSVSDDGTLAYQAGTEKEHQLTWIDHAGNVLGTVGESNDYQNIALAPDDKRAAVAGVDPGSGRLEVWIVDLANGSRLRIAPQDTNSLSPIWSPDGRELLLSHGGHSGLDLLRLRIDTPQPIPLLEGKGVNIATDWSKDGRRVAYTSSWPEGKWLGVVIKDVGSGTADPGKSVSARDHNECCATFSPISSPSGPRWIAYSSDESGQSQVYVADFPGGTHRWQVSALGGWLPHWGPDGRQLFFLAPDGTLMGSELTAGSSFAFHAPRPLFKTTVLAESYPTLPGNSYSVARKRQQFLVNVRNPKAGLEAITVRLPGK